MSMQLISTVTTSTTGTTNLTISSIPQTATDLLAVFSGRRIESNSPFAVENIYFGINGSVTAITTRYLVGTGSAASSSTDAFGLIGYIPSADATSNTFGSISIYIANYAGATNKSLSVDGVTENNATTARQIITAGLWPSTTAATSVNIGLVSGTLSIGSSLSLYAITKGSGGASVS
jgi:hypothetical protein